MSRVKTLDFPGMRYQERYQQMSPGSLALQGFPPAFCYFGAETLPNKGKPATRIFPTKAETLAPQ